MSDMQPLTEEELAASIDVDIDHSYEITSDDGYLPDEWRELLKKAHDKGSLNWSDIAYSDLISDAEIDVHLSVMNPPSWLTEGLDGPPPEPEPVDPDAYPFLPRAVLVSEDQAVLL